MNSEASVVRIVHLDDLTTEYSLKEFLLSSPLVLGAIKNVFINIDNELQIVFAYVIFEYHRDAKAVVNRLNGFCFQNKVLEIELIGVNLRYKRYTKQTSKSRAISTKSNAVSTNSLHIRYKTLNITSPTKNLDSQYNELDLDSPIDISPMNTRRPGEYIHAFKPATTIRTTTQTATNTLNSARFINKNNNETAAAASNSVKAKNDTPQAGTCTSRVSGLSSSASHLRLNRVSSNVTNNKIQAFFSIKAAANPRSTVLTQDKMPQTATLSSISSTMSHPDAFNRTQTEPTSSAVHQSDYATTGTSYSSLSSVRYQSNVSTEMKIPETSYPTRLSLMSSQNASTRPLAQKFYNPSVHHQNTATSTQTAPTSSPLSSAVHQSDYSTPGPSYSSLSSVRYQSNVFTEIKIPEASYPTKLPLMSSPNASTRPLAPKLYNSSVHHQTTATRTQTAATSSPLSSAVHPLNPFAPRISHSLLSSTRAQTSTTSSPLPLTVHQSNDSRLDTYHSSLYSVKHQSNACTKAQTPAIESPALFWLMSTPNDSTVPIIPTISHY